MLYQAACRISLYFIFIWNKNCFIECSTFRELPPQPEKLQYKANRQAEKFQKNAPGMVDPLNQPSRRISISVRAFCSNASCSKRYLSLRK